MKTKGKACETNADYIKKKCNKNAAWTADKVCQQSCFDAENGYVGDDCSHAK